MMDKIRDIAYAVVEAYTKNKTPLNDAILHISDTIDNDEVLKRVCELANQNVYLSLFHTPGIDRSCISFDVADFATLQKEINKRKLAMNDYAAAPDDHKKTLTITVVPVENTTVDKTAAIHDKYRLIAERDCLRKLANMLGMIKTSEIKSVEQHYNKILQDSLTIVHQGESLGDMAKLASRNIVEHGMDPTKIMEVYSEVAKMISDEGYHVNTEFTKTSSQKINPRAEILQPSKEIALSIEKVASINEMLSKVNRFIEAYGPLIN
jgi:hypothetical protein